MKTVYGLIVFDQEIVYLHCINIIKIGLNSFRYSSISHMKRVIKCVKKMQANAWSKWYVGAEHGQ
jgi:alanine-alpha-ketoisovalerate/valine-pyruvate aminotransferase